MPAIHDRMQGLQGLIFSSRDCWVSWVVHGNFLYCTRSISSPNPLRKECHRVEKWLSLPMLPIPRTHKIAPSDSLEDLETPSGKEYLRESKNENVYRKPMKIDCKR